MFNARHPDLRIAAKRIQECNIIKYAAYRTAAKLRILQRALFVDEVPLRIITGIFEKHRLQCTENSVLLNPSELEAVLFDIYFVVKKERIIDLDIDRATSLALEVLFGIFDRKKTNKIQVFSAKLGLAVLAEAKPREKYQLLFQQLSDHNNCLSQKKLQVILKNMTFISEYLNEEQSFSHNLIPGTIDSCFNNQSGTLGISEDMFLTWLLQDPQLLVWLSTSYRMQISEMACHAAKCSVCKAYPIVGLRYRCLRCLSYNQCQTCFFVGKSNKKHKLKHPVQEYCRQITSCQSTKAFLSTLKNKVKKTGHKLQYLPVQKVESGRSDVPPECSQLLDDMDISSRTVIHGSRISLHLNPQKELQSIILNLERENNEFLLHSIPTAQTSSEHLKDKLLKHGTQIETQIQRLKLLRTLLFGKRDFDNKALLESTPVVGDICKTRSAKAASAENLSPIARIGGLQPSDRNLTPNTLTWDRQDIAHIESSWKTADFSRGKMQNDFTFDSGSHNTEGIRACNNNGISDSALSTWIGGVELRDLECSSEDGFSWLHKEKGDKQRKIYDIENKENIDQENLDHSGKDLKKLHSDVDEIVGKLQKLLSNPNLSRLPENSADNDVESLLSDLMHACGQSANSH